jgi:hypothetical protein
MVIQELGVKFAVAPVGGQKTGHYCDQRDTRHDVGRLCKGLTVLDSFCYSGCVSLTRTRSRPFFQSLRASNHDVVCGVGRPPSHQRLPFETASCTAASGLRRRCRARPRWSASTRLRR